MLFINSMKVEVANAMIPAVWLPFLSFVFFHFLVCTWVVWACARMVLHSHRSLPSLVWVTCCGEKEGNKTCTLVLCLATWLIDWSVGWSVCRSGCWLVVVVASATFMRKICRDFAPVRVLRVLCKVRVRVRVRVFGFKAVIRHDIL